MNNYSANVVTSLEIPEFENIDQISENISQPTLKTIVKYRNYPSITAINEAFPNKYFNFSIIEKIFLIRLWNLNIKRLPKPLTFLSMFWKKTPIFFAKYLYIFFNESSKFLSSLKPANITSVFQKGSRNQKENYIPVSIFSIISKIFEKISSKQWYICFENMPSNFQCGFRKGFSTQHCLILMIEKWKEASGKD